MTATKTNAFQNMPELEVGTVLVADHGYSMILPTFYRIVSRTESSIWTKEIKSITTKSDGYGMNGYKIADMSDDSWKCDRRSCRRASIKGRSYPVVDGHYAQIWNGEPKMYDYMD